jgi:hypothetical protein
LHKLLAGFSHQVLLATLLWSYHLQLLQSPVSRLGASLGAASANCKRAVGIAMGTGTHVAMNRPKHTLEHQPLARLTGPVCFSLTKCPANTNIFLVFAGNYQK